MVTDLAWRYYCDRQREQGISPQRIASSLATALRRSQVYLRIGLARGWEKFPDRCYLQITGVYAFPDYLGGRTFADFAPTVCKENAMAYDTGQMNEGQFEPEDG